MTVFLCLAAPKFPTFNRWLRLGLTSALDEMTDTLNPPKLPVCFMLDELATLGHLPAVENAVGLAVGYGIQLVTVFQDVAPDARSLQGPLGVVHRQCRRAHNVSTQAESSS